MAYALPKLPFSPDALAPHMSRRTLELHHDKHHAAYVKKFNEAIEGKDYANLDIIEAVCRAHERGDTEVFNNGAQAWNHTFFWQCLTPQGGGRPEGALAKAIDRAFGSFDTFRSTFVETGVGCFGTGWIWLAMGDGELRVLATPDADFPQLQGLEPVLSCDVWEHAYYLDYQNERERFLQTFVDRLANWSFAEECLAAAGTSARAGTAGRVEGEGSYTAARSYRKRAEAFADSGEVEPAAREAAEAVDGPEGEELAAAEEAGRRHARPDPETEQGRPSSSQRSGG